MARYTLVSEFTCEDEALMLRFAPLLHAAIASALVKAADGSSAVLGISNMALTKCADDSPKTEQSNVVSIR